MGTRKSGSGASARKPTVEIRQGAGYLAYCYTTEESEKMEVLERAQKVGSMTRALRELAREKTEEKTIKKTENHE